MKKETKYISGLKGIACFFVMVGHFFGILKYIESGNLADSFRVLENAPIAIFTSESFWLYLFFLASGFLLAMGEVNKFSTLITKLVRRFFRLALPILFASGIILILTSFIGLHNDRTITLFENSWFQHSYSEDLTLIGVFLSPLQVLFTGKCIFNSPYWVLKDMFIASILIYVCLYIQSKVKKKKIIYYLIGYAFFLVALVISIKTAVCVLGMILLQHKHISDKLFTKLPWLGIVLLLLLTGMAVIKTEAYTAIPLFALIILITPLYVPLDKSLTCKPCMYLGKISFGVYSFHWPVCCSLGAYLLLATASLGMVQAFVICFAASICMTLLISIGFCYTAERAANWLVDRITNAISMLFRNNAKR